MRFLVAPVYVLIAALLAPSAEPGTADADLHLRLLRAEPAADTVIAQSPAALRLHFSEAPLERGIAVTIEHAAGTTGALGKPAPSGTDAAVLVVPVEEPLTAGKWTVTWRVLSRDSHVVRGELSFTVQPPNRP